MKRFLNSSIISIGLAIFSMFFGAGNIIYPLAVGILSGEKVILGIMSFSITALLLPMMGLIAMILYDGNYKAFFYRLGKVPGEFFIFCCIMIIGPIIAIPRITTLSHIMLAPYLSFCGLDVVNPYTSLIFALLFLTTTYLLTYKENNIVSLLGYVISPLLLISLLVIIIKGLFMAQDTILYTGTTQQLVQTSLFKGYATLDLLGALFFSSIIFTILKKTMGKDFETSKRLRISIILQSGLLGIFLLGLVYFGMGLLGAYHGHGLATLNSGDLFREISTRILGIKGTLVIAIAVLMACLSTAIALGAVVGEYLKETILRNCISFPAALFLTLLACLPLSVFGLDRILAIADGPLTYIGYPLLIMLTFCNIAYKMFNFKPVKIPVLLIFIFSLITYVW